MLYGEATLLFVEAILLFGETMVFCVRKAMLLFGVVMMLLGETIWMVNEDRLLLCEYMLLYIMPLYISSFLFFHNHIGKKLFLACVFCYFKTDVK